MIIEQADSTFLNRKLKGVICMVCHTMIVPPNTGEVVCVCAHRAFISVRANSSGKGNDICWGAEDLRAIKPIFG